MTIDSADLLALGAATLGEAGGQAMAARIKPAWPGAAVAGPAVTVACAPGDNLAVHVAVATAPAGSVLVVDASARPELGYWGEVLTTAAETAGIAGLVIDGGVRDVAALQAHGFPVFSSLVALRGATKVGPGTVGGMVAVGGVEVSNGDVVVGDVDGVVVIRGGELDAVLATGEARATKEADLFARLRDGATTLELLGLDAGAITQE